MSEQIKDGGSVDVLAVLRNAIAWMPNAVYTREMRDASAAVSKLLDACGGFCSTETDTGEPLIYIKGRHMDAFVAARARCGSAK